MKKTLRKLLTIALALCMIMSFMTVFANASPGDEDVSQNPPSIEDYAPKADLEDWQTGETVVSEDEHITITKEIVQRPGANQWDLKLTVKNDTPISAKPIYVALVLDYSSSMTNNSSTKLDNLKSSLVDDGGLLDKLLALGNVYVSVTTFNTKATKQLDMTKVTADNMETIEDAIDKNSANYTNVEDGIKVGAKTFDGIDEQKVMILMTDGQANTWYDADSNKNKTNTSDSTNADAAAKAQAALIPNIPIHTVGFGISANSNAEKLLKDIAASNNGTYSAVGSTGTAAQIADNLSTAFYNIVKLVNAMIIDPIGPGFKVVDNSASSTINGTADKAPWVVGNNIYWSPNANELATDDVVVVNYSLELVSIPQPGENEGIFNEQPTNGQAIFQYVYDTAPDDTIEVNFPIPTARFETGVLNVDMKVQNLDKWGNPITDSYTTTNLQLGAPVITDFTDGAVTTGPKAIDPSKSAPYTYTYNGYTITNGVVTAPDGTVLGDLATIDPALFDGKIATGVNTVVYTYDSELTDPVTFEIYKSFTLSGEANYVPAGVKFDFAVIAVAADTPSDEGGDEVAALTYADLVEMYNDGTGEGVVAKGSYTTKTGDKVGDRYAVTMKCIAGIEEMTGNFELYLIELNGGVSNWTYDDTIITAYGYNYGDGIWGVEEGANWTEAEGFYAPLFTNNFYAQTPPPPPPTYYNYTVEHQYYLVNEDGTRTIENTTTSTGSVLAGSSINPATIARVPGVYAFESITPNVVTVIAANGTTKFVLVYVRSEDPEIIITPPDTPLDPGEDIGDPDVPLTGDSSTLALWVTLSGLALGGIALTGMTGRKSKKGSK